MSEINKELIEAINETISKKENSYRSFYEIESCLEDGAYINTKDESGRTPLEIAFYKNDEEMIKFLISKGADISCNLLFKAVGSDNVEMTKLLTSRLDGKDNSINSTNINKNSVSSVDNAFSVFNELTNDDGKTLLHIAIGNRNKEMIKLLISKGADVTAGNRDNRTPLYDIVELGDQKIFDTFFEAIENKIQNKYPYSYQENQKKQEVIGISAIVTNKHDLNYETPMHIAAKHNNKEMIEKLISKGVGIDVKDKDGITPLHVIAKNSEKEILDILQSKSKINNINVNIKDNNGRTPLHYAAENNRTELVKLENKNSNLIIQNVNKKTIEILLLNGADINAQDKDGKTPLHYITQQKESNKVSQELINILLSKGADVNSKDKDGKTPLHYIMQQKNINQELIDILVSKGAKFDIRDNNKNTPLQYANKEVKEMINSALELAKKNPFRREGKINKKNVRHVGEVISSGIKTFVGNILKTTEEKKIKEEIKTRHEETNNNTSIIQDGISGLPQGQGININQ